MLGVAESLHFLQPIDAVTLSFLGTISWINIFTNVALAQALKPFYYPRIIGWQAIQIYYFFLLDWVFRPFAQTVDRPRMAAEIDRIDMIKREKSNQAGVRFINNNTIFRRADADPILVVDDYLQPFGKAYILLTDTIPLVRNDIA